MATLLDFTLLERFGGLFPILLVVVVAYALIAKFDLFSKNKFGALVLAALFGLVIGMTPTVSRAIQIMAPFYVLLFVALFFILLTMMTLGFKEETVTNYINEPATHGGWVGWTVGSIATLIFIVGFFRAFAEQGLVPGLGGEIPTDVSPQEAVFYQIFFHPKVMGMVLVLLVVIFTINRLAAEAIEIKAK